MDDFFGTPWSTLTIEEIATFLGEAGDEGLTWEAKGTIRPHADSVLKHVSAFSNTDGGFYIVGASREKKDGGPWHLDPVAFDDEPGLWLSRVIRNGLRPVPRFDIHGFEVDGKHVAVVNVDPIPEPPCITRGGQVFTRVSGESPRIEDPTTLRRLHERGEARAREAEGEALRGAAQVFSGPPAPYLYVAYSLAPIGRVVDISGVLFTKTFADTMKHTSSRLPPSPTFPYDDEPAFGLETRQNALVIADQRDNRQRWSLIASWDGAVTVAHEIRPTLSDKAALPATDVFAGVVRPAEEAASGLVAALGGHGRCRAVLRVHGRGFLLGDVQGRFAEVPDPDGILAIPTWTPDDGRLTNAQFSRMRRELVRACGVLVYEPDDDSDEAGVTN